jgi:hypothetical protein
VTSGDARPAETLQPAPYGESGMSGPPPHVRGKEGVDGSSPSEGSPEQGNRVRRCGLSWGCGQVSRDGFRERACTAEARISATTSEPQHRE